MSPIDAGSRRREAPPDPGEPRPVAFPEVRRRTLSCGLRLLVVESHNLPIAYSLLVVKAGAATDPANLRGLAAFTSNMLLEGTRKRTRAGILGQVEHVGGDLAAYSDEDRTTVGAQVLSGDLPGAIELVAEIASVPRFPGAAMKKVQQRMLGELKRSLTDPNFLGRRHLYRTLYGDSHPYGHVSATEESLRAIRRKNLEEFHARRLVPKAASLVVVGDVRSDEVQAIAERAFRSWESAGEAPSPPPDPPTPSGSIAGGKRVRCVHVVHRPGSVQATIFLAAPGLRRADDGWIPVILGNQVLGGSASGRLFMNLREQNSLTYGAYSSVAARRGVGLIACTGSSRNEVAGRALGEFLNEIDRLQTEPIPDGELKAAQSYLTGVFPTQIETPAGVASMIGQQEVYGLADDYWERYRDRVASVSESAARESVARLLAPSRLEVVVVGDRDAVAGQLEPFGPIVAWDSEGRRIA